MPKIYGEYGDHPGYFDHNSVVLLFPHIHRSPLNAAIPSLINFSLRKFVHPIIGWSATSPQVRIAWPSVIWGYVPLPKHLMQYMRNDRF